MAAPVGALILAGLEAASLLMKRLPTYSQKRREEFYADLEIFKLQQTLPNDHPDINDSLFLRVRDRLQQRVSEINSLARADGGNGKHVSDN